MPSYFLQGSRDGVSTGQVTNDLKQPMHEHKISTKIDLNQDLNLEPFWQHF